MEGVVDLLGATEPATETIPLLMSHLTFAASFVIGFILIFKEAGLRGFVETYKGFIESDKPVDKHHWELNVCEV